jgi:DNA-binding Xre family transcriptional regulator
MRYMVGKCLLADRLHALDIKPVELSRMTGIPMSTISGYLNGTYVMKIHNARTIAETLNCEPHDLYEWHRQSVK